MFSYTTSTSPPNIHAASDVEGRRATSCCLRGDTHRGSGIKNGVVNNGLSAAFAFFAFVAFVNMAKAAEQSNILLISRLDWKAITKNLPLADKKITKSGTGKTKQVWKIKGNQFAQLEVIGNNQNDADSVGWNCSEFDRNGNQIKQFSPESFCYRFFVRVLANVVGKPDVLAKKLLAQATQIHPRAATETFGDITIETDGEYYFLRRASRI